MNANDLISPASEADQYLLRVVELFLRKEEPQQDEVMQLLNEIVLYLQRAYPSQAEARKHA